MFCRYCGKELTDTPELCTNCGVSPASGTSFCPGCGAPTTSATEVCAQCGAQLGRPVTTKTRKTTAAGILAIVGGALCVTQWAAIAVVVVRALGWSGLGGIGAAAIGAVITAGIVAIVGGVFSLKRKRWGLALAGAICAIFSVVFIPVLLNVPLAIAAIVLIVLGKDDFQ